MLLRTLGPKGCENHVFAKVWGQKTRININADAHLGSKGGENHALSWLLRPQRKGTVELNIKHVLNLALELKLSLSLKY